MAVTVVLPAFNEEKAIAGQLDTIHRALTDAAITHEIIVVDDGSDDGTAEQVRGSHVRLIQHAENRGYGASLKTGIYAARYDTIAITDADGTYPADQIPVLLADLDRADMVVGARTGKHVKIPLVRRPAKWVLGWLANRIAGRRIPDLNSGLRVFRKDCAQQYFGILSNEFSFTTTVTLALLADGYRIVYRPINYYKRVGKSKITPKHFTEFLILVLRVAMLFNPLRVFVPVSLAVGTLGVIKVVLDIVASFPRRGVVDLSLFYNEMLSTSATILILAALQLLLVGMVADGVLRRIAQQGQRLVPSRAILDLSTLDKESDILQEPSGQLEHLTS